MTRPPFDASDFDRSKPSSRDLAHYIEETQGISKPWLLLQLRLAKLNEQKSEISAAEYAHTLADIHQDMMKLGEWWNGQEEQVFNP